jgi:hypothetical protein
MNTKLFILLLVVGLAGTWVVSGQSPSPAESPTPATHRTHKKKAASEAASPATAASRAATTEASPSSTEKPKRKAKTAAATSAAPATATKTAAGATATPAAGGGPGLVWVNTETHVFHKQGSRFYGTTKKGKYVSEADAIKEGDKPAKTE